MPKPIPASVLLSYVATVLIANGSLPEEAHVVADNLVMANLCGHDSHGVGMLPRYVDAVQEGGLVPNAHVKTLLDAGSLLSLHGQHGYGQVIGLEAIDLAIARTRQLGCCTMALAQSHHLGRIGHFAERAAAAGLVSVHFVNVQSRPIVAPWGGGDGRLGTNPMCIGVPLAGQPPFVLDFATSRVAQGKMRVAHHKGERVAPGLLIDGQGQPTTDPGVVVVPQAGGLFGALMPFGEHKGSGLAIACELLGGALTGGGTWHQPGDNRRAVLNSMLSIVIDAKQLGTQARFAQEAMAFVDWVKASPPGAGFEGVQIAGEPERRARAQREKTGLELDDGTWQEIAAAGRRLGVAPPV